MLGLDDVQTHNLGNLFVTLGIGGKMALEAYKFIKKEISAIKRKRSK